MKKKFLFASIIALAVTCFSACDDVNKPDKDVEKDNEEILDVDNLNPQTQVMDKEESADYLMQVGQMLTSSLNPADQKEVLELVDGYIYKLDNYRWQADGFEEYYEQVLEKKTDAMFRLPRYISNVLKGESPATIITFTVDELAPIFEANETTRNWEFKGVSKDGCAYLYFSDLNNNKCVFKLSTSGKKQEYQYTYYVVDREEDDYCYFGSKDPYKYLYVGYGNGDYAQVYDEYTRDWVYTPQTGGEYVRVPNYEYAYVGEGYGDYNYVRYDEVLGNEYEYVGEGKGKYIRLTPDQAVYRILWIEGEGRYEYKYDPEFGNYAKYSRHSSDYSEKPVEGAEAILIKATLPEQTAFVLKQNDNTLMEGAVNLDLQENDHYNFAMNFKIANIAYAMEEKLSHVAAGFKFGLSCGGASLFNVSIDLPTYELDKKSDDETYSEYGESIYESWESLVKKAGAGSVLVNIMQRVQLKGAIDNVGKLYRDYTNWSDDYDSDLGYIRNRDAAREIVNIYKKHCNAGLYYSSDVLQTTIVLEPYECEDHFHMEPLIYFPSDDTKYSYSQYFTERRFADVIDDAETVINSYIRLLKHFDIDPIELR